MRESMKAYISTRCSLVSFSLRIDTKETKNQAHTITYPAFLWMYITVVSCGDGTLAAIYDYRVGNNIYACAMRVCRLYIPSLCALRVGVY